MDIFSSSSKGRWSREKSRERHRDRPPRSAGVDTRNPRTVVNDYDDREYDSGRPRAVRDEDKGREDADFGGDNQERGDRHGPSGPPPKYSDRGRDEKGSKGRPQPYVDDRQGRDAREPYERRGSEVGEASYNKSYDSRRAASRYHSDRGRDRTEERSLGPEGRDNTVPSNKGLRELRVDDDSHYTNYPTAASPSVQYAGSQAGATSHNAKQYDVTLFAASTSYSPSHIRDTGPIVAEADHYRSNQATSDYQSARANDPTIIDPTYHPEPSDTIQAGHATAGYYPPRQNLSLSQPSYATPAAPAYCSPERDAAVFDSRQQDGPVAKRHQEAQQELDASYKVRKQDYMKFFKVGRVFMTLWHDELGSNASEQGSIVSTVIYGEKIYSKVRRFIVVRPGGDRRSATCLPIYSYGDNSQGKSSIKRDGHGFIYSRKKPKIVSGMCSKALRVIIAQNSQHLTDPSLVHYGKVHTVESNWKVKDIGVLDDDSIKTLLHYWRKTFGPVKDDRPEPGMTPHAKEAALAYVGAGIDSHLAAPTYGTYQSTTAREQHFASTSAPVGYPPPPTRGPYFGDRRSAEYHSPQSTSPTTGHGGYDYQSAYAASSYNTTSYEARTPYHGNDPTSNQGYSVAMASDRAISTAKYSPTISTTSARYNMHTFASDTPIPVAYEGLGGVVNPLVEDSPKSKNGSESEQPKSTEAPSEKFAATINSPNISTLDPTSAQGIKASSLDEVSNIPRLGGSSQIDCDRGRAATSKETQTASRSSSISSVSSLAFSENSKSSSSSLNSFGSQSDISERLFRVLWCDNELQGLFKESLAKVLPQRFEENLRRCLEQFSVHLREEGGSSPLDRQALKAARVVRKLSRSTAYRVRDAVEAANHELSNHDLDLECSDSELSDDDDIDDNEKDNDEYDELKDLETRLTAATSFQMLKENLKLFIRPNLVQKALFQIWPVTWPRSLPMEVKYNVESDVAHFLGEYFPKGQKLGGVLTLTGGPFNAQALSCRDYCTTTWPEVGSLLLEGLETLLSNDKEATVRDDQTFILFNCYADPASATSRLSITSRATHIVHSHLISALSWISAAVRYSTHDRISRSTTLVEAAKFPTGEKAISLKLQPLEPIYESTGACWQILFPHAVLATGPFPIRERQEGKGLEISFADMSLMSRSLSFVEFKGGLIVEGLTSLLVPVEELPKDDALQWHFEDKLQLESSRASRISSCLKPDRRRFKELDPQKLAERRCFLGWVEQAQVCIGTRNFANVRVRASGPAAGNSVRYLKSYAITLGTSAMGFVTATGSKSWAPCSVPSRLTLPIDKDIHDVLADGNDSYVIVYDNDAEIAWCLPQASLVLYLSHIIIRQRGYRILDGSAETSLGFAELDFDGAAKASDVLRASLRLTVKKSDDFECGFAETVKQIWHVLDKAGSGLKSAEAEFEIVKEGLPQYIHGVDLWDIVKMNECPPIKRAEINQPWAHLTAAQPIVLFCKEFGQPIIPAHTEDMCESWTAVPSNQNYFVAMGIYIQKLLFEQEDRQKGSRLGHKVLWVRERPDALIQSHRQGRSNVRHIQRLQTVYDAQFDQQLAEILRSHRSSCFVFAERSLVTRCLEPLRRRITSSFIRPLEKALPELPDSASATSAGTERGSDIAPNLDDSMSSSESRDLPSQLGFSETVSIRSHSPRRSPTAESQQSDPQVSERSRQDQCGKSTMSPTTGTESCLSPPNSLRRKQKMTLLRGANMSAQTARSGMGNFELFMESAVPQFGGMSNGRHNSGQPAQGGIKNSPVTSAPLANTCFNGDRWYLSQRASTTDYYGPHYTSSNPQAAGGAAYETYPPPHQVPESEAPVYPIPNNGHGGTSRYPKTGSATYGYNATYEDPRSEQFLAARSASLYRDSAIVPASDENIHLGETVEDPQMLRPKQRQDSQAGERRRHSDRARRI